MVPRGARSRVTRRGARSLVLSNWHPAWRWPRGDGDTHGCQQGGRDPAGRSHSALQTVILAKPPHGDPYGEGFGDLGWRGGTPKLQEVALGGHWGHPSWKQDLFGDIPVGSQTFLGSPGAGISPKPSAQHLSLCWSPGARHKSPCAPNQGWAPSKIPPRRILGW